MRCPTLGELPAPPPGRTGWPWTEESPQQSGPTATSIVGGQARVSHCPRVSIVTPSYNQAQFVEETIRSVLLQGYADLEYIVIDGGSQDGSVDIIRKYEKWLAHWVSEPDRGQSDALNKGFARATGEILGWNNSDDLYCPGAISHVAALFQNEPDTQVVYGSCYDIDATGKKIDEHWAMPFDRRFPLYSGTGLHNQAMFWRRSLMRQVGMLDPNLQFCMDRDFVLRLIWNGKVARTTAYLGAFRVHAGSKTAQMQDLHRREREMVKLRYQHYHPTVLPPWFWKLYLDLKRSAVIVSEAGVSHALAKLPVKLGRKLHLGSLVDRIGKS